MSAAAAVATGVGPTLEAPLPTGRLTVRVDRESPGFGLERLCAFAARDNRRRGFLVVSRVLGRHLPARPGELAAAAAGLASELPADLPEPVVVLGLAETAVALADLVHEAWVARSGARSSLFLHSTRQRTGRPVLATFREPHSHARGHLIHRPAGAAAACLLLDARSLILVDDEMTSGATLTNALAALRPHMPRLVRVTAAVLTDWSADRPTGLPEGPPAALLRGALDWRDLSSSPVVAAATAADGFGRLSVRRDFGRLGRPGPAPDFSSLAERLLRGDPRPILVLGLGEFCGAPHRLALALEARGGDVRVQAATRSPILPGGPIGLRLTFPDAYDAKVPNYLYGFRAEPGRRVLLCHETERPPTGLAERLGAEPVDLGAPG